MNVFTVRAALSILVLTGCSFGSEDVDCAYTKDVRRIDGELAFTESKASHDEFLAWWTSSLHPDMGAAPDAGADADTRTDADTGTETEAPQPPPTARRVDRVGGSENEPIVLDAPCPSAFERCVRVRFALGDFTFRRPTEGGKYALRGLGAKLCETVYFPSRGGPPERSLRCVDLDGELVVRDVVAPCRSDADPEGGACARFDGDITIDARSDDAPGPRASGQARLVVRADEVVVHCTKGGGGCGRWPGGPGQ